MSGERVDDHAFPVSTIDGYTQCGMTVRQVIAKELLAGFASNPAVFAANSGCGWSLVNCSEDDLAAYCVRMADKLIEAESRIQPDGQGE